MLNSKTENELVKEFVNFLIKQGYPSKQICQEKCIVSKTAKVYGRLDIAIVVGDKIIEAFEFKKYAKNKTHRINDFLGQLSLYQEHIDSSVLSNDIHLTTYDKGEWWVYSRWNDTWLLAKDILSFDRVASEFYIKAYEQAKDTATPIEKPNFKWIRITCWSVSIVALLYIIAYIVLYTVKSCGKSVCDLPLSLEVISMFVIIGVSLVLPTLFPFIKSIKFNGTELQLYATNYFQIKSERH